MGSKKLLEYVWETQVLPQAGYSFSRLHAVGYSLIALQEMNLAHFYPQVYWNTACLSVSAGADENNDDNKSTNYGKIAYAIGNMKHRGINVSLPDVNKAGFGFRPDTESNSIIFGLKGISGIGDEVAQLIVSNRPYASFEDFIKRMYEEGLVKKTHMLQLIKAGSFDSFGSRLDIMKQFIGILYEPKSKLTMANLNMIIEMDLMPSELNVYKRYFKFKDYISKSVFKTITKPKDKQFILDEISTQFFNDHFSDEHIVDVHNGQYIISEKSFKKEYDKKMTPVKDWLTNEELLQQVNEKLLESEWNNYCTGSTSKWEMSSISYYHGEHELEHVDKSKYGIGNYSAMSDEPKVVDTYKSRGREYQQFETTRIVGTVLDKDKNKHTVTLLTTDGVVICKFYGGAYSHYDRQISKRDSNGKKTVLESSWFARGNLLMVTGYRRGNQFIPKVYKGSIYQHTVAMINEIDEEGSLNLTTERIQL